MADLRSVTYGSTTFTIPTGGDYEARVAALETSVAALQAQLSDYEPVRLRMEDPDGRATQYDVLGKFIDSRPVNMFEARSGAYDAEGNWLGGLDHGDPDSSSYDPSHEYMTVGSYGDPGYYMSAVYVDRILAAYPTARGIVIDYARSTSDGMFKNAASGDLDWIVLYDEGLSIAEYPDMGYTTTLFGGGVTDAVGTIYVGDNTNAPWGQTNATINTTGTPVPWTV